MSVIGGTALGTGGQGYSVKGMSGSNIAERRAANFSNRHREFLLAAIASMRSDGVTAVNLTDLAADSSYSKGTWYNHFRSAEALLVDIAVVNADIQHAYIADIIAARSLDGGAKLASVFISFVAHAITHPEIWTLGINARIWDKKPEAGVNEAVERLTAVEDRNYELILDLAYTAQLEPRDEDATTAALDIVRAAADGLGVLTTAKAEHRWSREVTTRQTGALLTSSLAAAGFRCPSQSEMDQLCTQSWERVGRMSGEWLIPRP